MTAVPTPATVWHPVQSGTTTRKGHTVPTQFAQQSEQAMLKLTFSQGGNSWGREYRRNHQDRKLTRRMIREDARS
jgi:hypothetical protein